MKLVYRYDEKQLELTETLNGEDIEFSLSLFEKELKNRIEKIRDYFKQNNILTDILIYTHANHSYQIIVRKDFYDDFVLQLFKQKLLMEIKWI